jgi:hypothetical protein
MYQAETAWRLSVLHADDLRKQKARMLPIYDNPLNSLSEPAAHPLAVEDPWTRDGLSPVDRRRW